eukprot:CAMPEP_0172326214 /NCGR_PEP_ID=MMETSP1058-20130122/55900_1 /TAXON_ID=83371 /ORGANISM="Detonula confervacea, Strain CCMP 353" /LENGTH=128 /DNA_ID=CAMNT_0013042941 /DNA_START=98 /DNA_END=481 /DNA_ORIENTATION=+
MMELTTLSKEETEPLHHSPLMMEEETMAHNDHDNDAENDKEYYGADPLVVNDNQPSPSPSPHPQQSPVYPSSKSTVIKHKLLLLTPLLLILYMLTDSDYYETTTNNETSPKKLHHLAFITALSRHPPS